MKTADFGRDGGQAGGTAGRMLLSVREAARALGIGQRTLQRITHDGGIPCVRIGARVLYDPRDLERWIEANKSGRLPAA